jgi:ketosteroid isomerase-like protein
VTETLDFGVGLERIGTVVRFLAALRDRDVPGLAAVLHPEVRIAPIVGLTPAQGYEGIDEAVAYLRDTQRQDVRIEPDAFAFALTQGGAVVGHGRLRVTMAGTSDETEATVTYEFRDGRISSLKGHLA